jgi:histone deacetylase complex subunit SAP18
MFDAIYVTDLDEQTAPFLVRAFVKLGGFHPTRVFEDGPLPIVDEHQLFTWYASPNRIQIDIILTYQLHRKDATLPEILTTLRLAAPNNTELKHALARFSFRSIFADSTARGRWTIKELGSVHSKDVLAPLPTLSNSSTADSADADVDIAATSPTTKHDDKDSNTNTKTLDTLLFHPGDYLLVSVNLPKHVAGPTGPTGDLALKGAAARQGPQGSHSSLGARLGADGGWGGTLGPASSGAGAGAGAVRGGGGHWRGGSDPAGRGGGGGGRGGGAGRAPPPRERDRDANRDRDRDTDRSSYRDRDDPRDSGKGDRGDRDRRPPPPRRDSPPARRGSGRGARSRSRSPPRRRY